MSRFPGHIIRAEPILPTLGGASGIWTMADAMRALEDGAWPQPTPPITSMSLIAATTSATSDTCTAPASGIEPGDLLVFCDHAIQTSPASLPTIVIPSGFTQKAQFDLDTARRFVYSTKIADGTEDAAVLTGMTGNFSRGKAILQFRADVAISSVAAAVGTGFTGSASTTVTRAVSVSGANAPLLLIGWGSGNNGTFGLDQQVSAVSVEDGEQRFNGVAGNTVNWNFFDSSPQNTNVIVTSGGSQMWAGGFCLPVL